MNAKAFLIEHDNLNLHVEDQGEGSPALVFLHFWGGSGRTWTSVIDALADRFRCITIDLRGWGRSDRQAENYSLHAQAGDVEHVIAVLGLKDFVLVGHAMGGKIAQILASENPPGLRGVVLVAPAPPTPVLIQDEQKQAMLQSYASPEGVQKALRVLAHRPLTDDQRREVMEDILGGAPRAKQAWVQDGMALDISTRAAAIRAPVSVIVGLMDQVEREPFLHATFRAILPRASFEVLSDVGHLSPLEAPKSLAEAISDFADRPERLNNS